MRDISNYRIVSKLYESSNSLVYRAHRETDGHPVILKILKQDYPNPDELTRYKQEYDITRELARPGVIQVYDLLPYERTLAMVVEDFGGSSLHLLMQSKAFALEEALVIAIEVAKAIGNIHAANVIHKDINPSNIVLNPDTGLLKIIDFGMSTVFTHENPTFQNPEVLAGTLAYMSPEQTGRMNRGLDYRTDFYSFGVTLYELLTQYLPFDADDPMELVHHHLARTCEAPSSRVPGIPTTVSDIVMKLLAKTAEERYQSALGIQVDLESCLEHLRQTGTIAAFPLASHDVSERFVMPQKLYGREAETRALLEVFERVSEGSSKSTQTVAEEMPRPSAELMLVEGYAGIGKSVLVQQLYRPITAQRGYFIAGKFDQFRRNVPYSAVVAALQSLVRHLLTESADQLAVWQERLAAAFGPNGQLILDVIPEIERIVGPQCPLPQMEPTEANRRFTTAFQNLIRTFCQPEHPLVMFLDDLQWADSASLKLLELMMTDERTTHLLVLGAYRDNEVDANHPTIRTIERVQAQGGIVNRLILGPLPLSETAQFVADTLHHKVEKVTPLASLIAQKTSGNPFFINEFLHTLYQEQYVTFDRECGAWQWDIAQISALGATDNVVDLLLRGLKKLPVTTQAVLQLAACIGNGFDLASLAVIYQHGALETFRDLMPAMQLGLVQPLSAFEVMGDDLIEAGLVIQDFKFRHDRVQQASYALIDEAQKSVLHLRIGRQLLAHLSEEMRDEKTFTLVDHLNHGEALIEDEAERLSLVKLNLQAGKKAKLSNAYLASRDYLRQAERLFSGDMWAEQYDIALDLYRELSEIEYLNGDFDTSQALLDVSIQQAKSALDCTDFYYQKIVQLTLAGQYGEAIDLGRTVLRRLGYDLATDDFQSAFEAELDVYRHHLAGREIASLYDSPEMTEPEPQAALKILSRIFPACSVSNPILKAVVGTKIVNLSLQYGHIPISSSGYSFFGAINVFFLDDYHTGYAFGELGLRLADKYNHLVSKSVATQFHGNLTMPWIQHVKLAETINDEGVDAGLQVGDFQVVGYTLIYRLYTLIYQGKNLEWLLQEVLQSLEFVRNTQNQWAINCLLAAKMVIYNLLGLTQDQFSFDIDEIQEDPFLNECQEAQILAAACQYYIFKAQALFVYGQTVPLRELEKAGEWIGFIPATISTAKHNFYHSLALAASYPDASVNVQAQYWKDIEANQKIMKRWADHCPENFLHKHLLVAAEMARITGAWYDAMNLYDQAIESAREHEFVQNEALANELAAKFWSGLGKTDFAQLYLRKAHQGYQLWGANAKVKALEDAHPYLLRQTESSFQLLPTTGTTQRQASRALDLNSVLKASQAISSEIVLEKLLDTLMRVVIENAGAQRGCLILNTNDQLVVEAEKAAGEASVLVRQSMPIDERDDIPETLIRYVARTQTEVVLNDATQESLFARDPYLVQHQPIAVLCMPLVHQGKLAGILYLENDLAVGAFSADRLAVLNLLTSQEVIAIENARLYRHLQEVNTQLENYNETLEQRVADRTQELEEKNLDLEVANRQILEATEHKTRFFNNMSHELRTPLDSIIGFSEVLQEQAFGELTEKQEEYVGYILSSGSHLLNLINSILDLAKIDAGMMNLHCEVLSLQPLLIRSLVMLRERAAERDIELSLDVADDVDTIFGDELRVQEILLNLLSNAVKFTPLGGNVGIRATRVAAWVWIEVWDTGIGIAPEDQPLIFDEFQQVEQRGSAHAAGTGLGLALTKKFVELHGGQITVKSRLGDGSTFTFSLPTTDAAGHTPGLVVLKKWLTLPDWKTFQT